jgi:hypothetical protein
MPLSTFPPFRPFATLLALAAMLALSPVIAQEVKDSSNPLHLRRVGHGNVEGLKLNIGVSIEACRTAKKLPLNAPKILPPDDYLAKLVTAEEEEFFDGGRWAQYGTQRSVLADPSSGDCRLALFTSRGVRIEQTCESRYSAVMPTTQEMADPEDPKPPKAEVSTGPGGNCRKKPKALPTQGLPTENAGEGTLCIWFADATAAMMRTAGLKSPGHDAKTQDFCLYARQPEYFWRGHVRQVVLKSSGSDESLAGNDISEIFGEVRGQSNQRLAEFSDGRPIPPERFSRAGAEAFLNQPAKTPLKP